MSDCPIALRGVTVSYSPAVMGRSWVIDRLRGAKRQGFVSLRGIDLDLRRGDSLGVVGNNGAGKTTLLKLMAGILPPTSGRIEIKGEVTALLDLGAGVEGHLTAWENIDLSASLHRIPQAKRGDFRRYVSEFSELGEALNRPIRTYSAGMMLRLIFSLRTYATPDILVVDEVFGVGDRHFASKTQKRILEILHNASTLALASHDFGLIKQFCTHAVWLEKGRIVRFGPAAEVLAAYQAAPVPAT